MTCTHTSSKNGSETRFHSVQLEEVRAMAKAYKAAKKSATKKAKEESVMAPPEPKMEGAAGSPKGSVNRTASKKNPKAAENQAEPKKNEPPPGRSPAEIQAANPPEITDEQNKSTMFPKKF
jgi:hypothetical protein